MDGDWVEEQVMEENETLAMIEELISVFCETGRRLNHEEEVEMAITLDAAVPDGDWGMTDGDWDGRDREWDMDDENDLCAEAKRWLREAQRFNRADEEEQGKII